MGGAGVNKKGRQAYHIYSCCRPPHQRHSRPRTWGQIYNFSARRKQLKSTTTTTTISHQLPKPLQLKQKTHTHISMQQSTHRTRMDSNSFDPRARTMQVTQINSCNPLPPPSPNPTNTTNSKKQSKQKTEEYYKYSTAVVIHPHLGSDCYTLHSSSLYAGGI